LQWQRWRQIVKFKILTLEKGWGEDGPEEESDQLAWWAPQPADPLRRSGARAGAAAVVPVQRDRRQQRAGKARAQALERQPAATG